MPVRGVDDAEWRRLRWIGEGREDLLHDERRATIARSSGTSPEVLGANRLADHIGDLDACLA